VEHVSNARARTIITEGVQCNYTDDTVWDRTIVESEHATRRASSEVMRGAPTLKMAVLNW